MIIKAVKVRHGGMKVKILHQPDPEIDGSIPCLEKEGWGINALTQTHNMLYFEGLVSVPLPSSEIKSKGIKFICAGCNWFKSLSSCTFYPGIELQPVKYSHHHDLCDNSNNHKHFLSHTLILSVSAWSHWIKSVPPLQTVALDMKEKPSRFVADVFSPPQKFSSYTLLED